mgnify:FL=1
MGSARSKYPDAATKREVFIPAHSFPGVTEGSWVPGATTEFLDFLFPLPDDMLVGDEVGFKVVWSADTASAADSATWRVLYNKVTTDTTSGVTAPATALGTTIADDTKIATANAVQITPRGKILANVLTGMTAGADFLKLRVNVNSVTSMTLGTDKVDFLGLIVDYVPRFI